MQMKFASSNTLDKLWVEMEEQVALCSRHSLVVIQTSYLFSFCHQSYHHLLPNLPKKQLIAFILQQLLQREHKKSPVSTYAHTNSDWEEKKDRTQRSAMLHTPVSLTFNKLESRKLLSLGSEFKIRLNDGKWQEWRHRSHRVAVGLGHKTCCSGCKHTLPGRLRRKPYSPT